jgi:hypothetical protein
MGNTPVIDADLGDVAGKFGLTPAQSYFQYAASWQPRRATS